MEIAVKLHQAGHVLGQIAAQIIGLRGCGQYHCERGKACWNGFGHGFWSPYTMDHMEQGPWANFAAAVARWFSGTPILQTQLP